MSWTHTYRVTLAAEPERVFRALTDSGELRQWFAEHAEMAPPPGGQLRFWGRYTYGVPSREEGDHPITRFEPGRALAFRWRFEGADSEVVLELAAEPAKDAGGPPATALSLAQTFAAKPAAPYAEELVEDHWRLVLGNLDAHLRGGEGVVRPDYTDPNPEIRLSIVIDAPRERVFRALVEPEALNRWIASAASVEPRVGGAYTYGWKYKHGGRDVEGGPTKILDFVENERIVTDWPDWRGDESRGRTRVAWILESVGAKTRVTLVHSGFSRLADIGDYPFGWGGFLEQLKGEVEAH
ncbi:MAG: SRPBCC family protein [Thermoanaerobaculia bacterium]